MNAERLEALKKRLAELQELCDAATEGPWAAQITSIAVGLMYTKDQRRFVGEMQSETDAAFCAEARTALPQLLKAVEIMMKILVGPREDRPGVSFTSTSVVHRLADALGLEE